MAGPLDAALGLPDDGRPIVVWGVGNAFRNFVRAGSPVEIAYAVDDVASGSIVEGIRVRSPSELPRSGKRPRVVVCTLSSDVLHKIADKLEALGYAWGQDAIDHVPLAAESFRRRMATLGIELDGGSLAAIRALFWNLRVANHSSALGSWLLWALLRQTRSVPGDAVELGVYEGGNALTLASLMALEGDPRAYHLVDSFEGFREFSEHDPKGVEHMFRDNSEERVRRRFATLPNARITRGFVPEVLAHLDAQQYSFVYYDCDLYQPALDSLEHFLDRIPPGGVFVADDYSVTKDFLGVRRAVDEFCAARRLQAVEIPETTHVLIRK